jgi:hypothetical protein
MPGATTETQSDQWSIGQLRFSVISAQAQTISGSSVFETFFGFAPDVENHRRMDSVSEFASSRGGIGYSVVLGGPKMDVVMTAELSQPDPTGFPVLQEPNIHNQFRDSAIRAVELFAHGSRLAVGQIFLSQASSQVHGYEILSKFLPFAVDSVGSSDFQYRINRPREIQTSDGLVKINRLSTWACGALQKFSPTPIGLMSTPIAFAAQLETDINTLPDVDVSGFTTDAKQQIIGALFDFSKELADNGDLP